MKKIIAGQKRITSFALALCMMLSLFTMLPIEADAAAKSSVGLSLAYDFEGGTAGSALEADFLAPAATSWYTASVTEGLSFAEDPANAENTVVNGNGTITFADTNGALVGKRFSTEMKLYVETMPTAATSLATWNSDSAVQLLGLGADGKLQVGTTATAATVATGVWNTLRADVYPKRYKP